MRDRSHSRLGLTLLEVVVVALVLLVVVGLVCILLVRQRESADRVQCMNHLRRIGVGIQSYCDGTSTVAAQRRLPASRIEVGYATWGVLLMPYLEVKNHLLEWRPGESYFAQPAEVREAVVPFYFCAARPRHGIWVSQAGDQNAGTKESAPGALGDYAAVAASGIPWTDEKADGAMLVGQVLKRAGDRIESWQGRVLLASLARGTAYTVLIGEKHVPTGHQADAAEGDGSLYNGNMPASFSRIAGPGFGIAPSPDTPFRRNFGSNHPGLCFFLNADASVRSLAPSVPEELLGKLSRRN